MNKKTKSKIFFKLAPILVLVFLIGLMASCSTGQGESNGQETGSQDKEYDVPITAKKWALLLYDDAEF